jgi:hypothetical protein
MEHPSCDNKVCEVSSLLCIEYPSQCTIPLVLGLSGNRLNRQLMQESVTDGTTVSFKSLTSGKERICIKRRATILRGISMNAKEDGHCVLPHSTYQKTSYLLPILENHSCICDPASCQVYSCQYSSMHQTYAA